MKVISGPRVAATGRIAVGCSAAIFDQDQRVLLTKRADNGEWCLPGGHMEPGESATEACIREVLEETGFSGTVAALIGVYSSPTFLIEYPGGSRLHIVALLFEVIGERVWFERSMEVTEQRFFARYELPAVSVFEFHRQRIDDCFEYAKDREGWSTRFD
jgi:8-oxo-dGTP pyrophosphatase MutT (NUDIX family)